MTKKDIANQLVRQTKISHALALFVVNEFFDQIKNTLTKGEVVKLSGFGNFVLREKSARPGRNPKTNEEVLISPRTVVTFKAGPKLKAITQK